MIEGTVKNLSIVIGGQHVGMLSKDSAYRMTYNEAVTPETAVALAMPPRFNQYSQSVLFPIFQMNLPEGYVRHYIAEKLRRFATVNDMLYLALSSDIGSGRIAYQQEQQLSECDSTESLSNILSWDGKEPVFDYLVDKYLLKTTVGISGVQPKVLVPEMRGSTFTPSLIVKSSDAALPDLAVNEFICMQIAKTAGLDTPECWLSDDHALFVMRRFDLVDGGLRLGMEDFAVLMNRAVDDKYQGRYETLMKAAALYSLDTTDLFRRIAVSCIVGDGDAHLKNFAALYENPTCKPVLSPAFDIVNTQLYGYRSLALKLENSRSFPGYSTLVRFGEKFHIKESGIILEEILAAVDEVMVAHSDLLKQYPKIRKAIMDAANAVKPT